MMGPIHFKFQGDSTKDVEDVSVSIPREALEGKETFLSTMVVPAWNESARGRNIATPIVVKPLLALSEWDAAMAHVVVCAQSDMPLVLPEGVELENLLCALDYFQLSPPDGGASVDLSKCSISEGIRARTFVQDSAHFASAMEHVTATLKKATTMETYFVFRKAAFSLTTINATGLFKYRDVCIQNGRAVSGADAHLSWSSKVYYRDAMATQLAKLGVRATWSNKLLQYFAPCEYGPMESSPRFAKMWTLAINISPATPKLKRRRLNSEGDNM